MEKKTRKRVRANGDGCIILLAGKRKRPFAVRITSGFNSGKQIFKYVGFYETKTLAKKALNEYLVKPYNLNRNKTSSIFKKWSVSANISDEVIRQYYLILERTKLIDREFNSITFDELDGIRKTFTPSMQRIFKNALSNLYSYSLKCDICTKNLGELLVNDKYIHKEKTAMDEETVNYILRSNDKVAIVLLYTGMRINEVLNLKVENIQLEKRLIIGGSKTEAGKNRKIPIHRNILPIIEELYNKADNYLFVNSLGNRLAYGNYFQTYWSKNKHLKNYTIHQTRHTFISRAAKLKLNKSVLQKVIGHSNKDVTDIYTHIDEEQLFEFIDNFNY